MDSPVQQADNTSPSNLPDVWDPLFKILDLHPTYLDTFTNTIYTLFYGTSNLSASIKHFIAIMAATRHRCHFLIDLHTREYDRLGGNQKWLRGIDCVDDPKIVSLDRLNMVLAHQPWLVNANYLDKVVRSSCSSTPLWSQSDIAHAAVILSHTHATASFIHAVGDIHPVAISANELLSLANRFESTLDKENTNHSEYQVEDLLRKMKELRTVAESNVARNTNTQLFNSLADGSHDDEKGAESPDRSCDSPFLSSNINFAYVDFAVRTDSTKTFKSHEFTWEHGFLVLEDINKPLATTLDNKFKGTQALTYGFMGGFDNVDTTGYRTAIWNYIQALFGIRHDDYDYSAVNQLLSREMKTFVKTVACFPHRLTDELRASVMPDFKLSEKVHVVMMIMEARLQASMLWYTRTITNYYAAQNRNAATRQLD